MPPTSTRQLLTFSRKQVVQPRVVDLHVELPQIRTLLSRLMPETIAVEAGIDAEVWPIEIDPVQLTQVLINLAINGRDAMPRGGRLRCTSATACCATSTRWRRATRRRATTSRSRSPTTASACRRR